MADVGLRGFHVVVGAPVHCVLAVLAHREFGGGERARRRVARGLFEGGHTHGRGSVTDLFVLV